MPIDNNITGNPEVDAMRELKVKFADRLLYTTKHPGKRAREVLKREDPRLKAYILEVARHPERHNIYEIAGVLRWYMLVNKYDWNYKLLRTFITYYETCCIFNGNDGPSRYKVTPVLYFMLSVIYGLQVPESTRKARINGRVVTQTVRAHRLIRFDIWYVPRKFSKTTNMAAIATFDLLFGDFNSHVFMASNSQDQSQICYDETYYVMQNLFPSLKSRKKDNDKKLNLEAIYYNDPKTGRHSYIKCLANTPAKKDGLNASTIVMDEYSQSVDTEKKKGNEMLTVLTTSTATRREPLTMIITTASDKLSGPFHSVDLPHAQNVLLGIEEGADTEFYHLFQPDAGDDPGELSTWEKVQPHLYVTVQPEFYVEQWAQAQKSQQDMVIFKTKLLNLPCENMLTSWLGSALAKKLHYHWDPLTGVGLDGTFSIDNVSVGTMATDLSLNGDFTAVTTLLHFQELGITLTHTKWFMCDGISVMNEVAPDGSVIVREEAPFDGQIHSDHPRKAYYQRLVDQGYIQLTHGTIIDQNAVADYTMQVCCEGACAGLIESIGYDNFRSTTYVNHLVECGPIGLEEHLKPIGQTIGAFTPSTMGYGMAARTGHIMLDDNPLIDECYAGAYLEMSKDETCGKPMKIDASPTGKRIDGLITNVMAFDLLINRGHRRRDNDIEK